MTARPITYPLSLPLDHDKARKAEVGQFVMRDTPTTLRRATCVIIELLDGDEAAAVTAWIKARALPHAGPDGDA